MYNFSIENLIDVFTVLEFTDVDFSYKDLNDFYFNAKSDDRKVTIIFNLYQKEVDYYYNSSPNDIFSVCNLKKTSLFRKDIHNILIRKEVESDEDITFSSYTAQDEFYDIPFNLTCYDIPFDLDFIKSNQFDTSFELEAAN